MKNICMIMLVLSLAASMFTACGCSGNVPSEESTTHPVTTRPKDSQSTGATTGDKHENPDLRRRQHMEPLR